MRAAIERTVVAPAVPLSAELERALDASFERCRDTDTRYYTPHMLLVLIDLGDGVVRSCFDRVEPGLAGQIRTEVAHYVAEAYARAAEPFIAFRWRERNDVRRAQRLAAEAESPIVTSGLLFAGVLDTESSTQKQLRARLGPPRVDARNPTVCICRR